MDSTLGQILDRLQELLIERNRLTDIIQEQGRQLQTLSIQNAELEMQVQLLTGDMIATDVADERLAG